MSTFTYSYKPDAMLGSLGCIFLKKAASFLKGRLTCVLIQQQGNNFFKLIFSSVNFHFPERCTIKRMDVCLGIWYFGEVFEISDSLGDFFFFF